MMTDKNNALTPADAPVASPTPAPTPPPTPTVPTPGHARHGRRQWQQQRYQGRASELRTPGHRRASGVLSARRRVPAGAGCHDPRPAHRIVSAVHRVRRDHQGQATWAWRADVQSERAVEQAVACRSARVRKAVLVGRFGKSGTQLEKFGFVPAKAGTRTTLGKTTAVAKAAATRIARGTKGSVQKQKVTG